MKETDQLLTLQRQLIITVLLILLLALVFVVGTFFGDILRILGIALVLAYMVINIVDWLEKILKNRALAVILVFISMLAVMSVSALLIVPAVVFQITQLVQTTINAVPEWLGKLTQMITPIEQRFHQYQIDVKAIDILNNVIANLPKPDATMVMSRVSDVAMGTMTWLLYWVSISVVTFYFLLDGNKITDALINLFPGQQQPFLRRVAADADKSLQSFFRGQLVLGIAFGLVMLVIYTLLGVQYALLLGIFLGVMEILPVIGPPIGFAPAILSVIFHGMSIPVNRFMQVLILTAVFSVLQQFKDNFVAPKYIGNVIGLHPIMIFIAIMIGARLDGTLGIIFALPVACVANVFFSHLHASWTRNGSEEKDESSQNEKPASPPGEKQAAGPDDTANESSDLKSGLNEPG